MQINLTTRWPASLWDDDYMSEHESPAEGNMPTPGDEPLGSESHAKQSHPHHERESLMDPAIAASLAAGAAWLAGKGVHRIRKKRTAKRGEARTIIGAKASHVMWTATAAVAAAVVERIVSRLITRNRGK